MRKIFAITAVIVFFVSFTLLGYGDSGDSNLPPKTTACGDVNLDGAVNIFDVTFLIAYLYTGGPSPVYLQLCDVDHSGVVNIFDVTRMIGYLYLGGEALDCPPLPSPSGYMVATSDCLNYGDRDAPPDQDCIDYKYDGSSVLLLTHQNACFNCCPESVFADIYISNNTITIYEDETYDSAGPCPCLCLNNIDYQFENIPPGEYTIKIYGLCLMPEDEILETTINLASDPEGVYCITRIEYPWGYWDPPQGAMVGHSDTCKTNSLTKDTALTEDCVVYEYDGVSKLYLTHLNDLFNCCPDSLMAEITIEDSIISITENEDLSSGGCYCICLYDLDYEINNLPPGIYTIKVDNPFYYGQYDNGIIIEFTVDLITEPSGYFCVDRPYLPME